MIQMALLKKRIATFSPNAINKKPTEETVDFTPFKQKVSRLVRYGHLPIASIPEADRLIFEEIREDVYKYFNTKWYDELFEIVKNEFGMSIDTVVDGQHAIARVSVPFLPKTIGAYFTGCLAKTNITDVTQDVNDGCSLLAAGNMPRPTPGNTSGNTLPDVKWTFCSQNVIWCQLKVIHPANTVEEISKMGGDFEFLFLTKISNNTNAILFVNYDNYEEFPGFTDVEKETLRKLKIFNVKLLSYNKEGTEYKDLIGEVTSVKDLKKREDNTPAKIPKEIVEKITRSEDPLSVSKEIVKVADPVNLLINKVIYTVAIILVFLLMFFAYKSIRK